MKCKSCAGNYKTKELICPYCGRANLLGKLWFAEKSEAEQEYEIKNNGPEFEEFAKQLIKKTAKKKKT